MHRLTDYSEARWLEDQPGARLYGGVCPVGYASYTRIFHAIFEAPEPHHPGEGVNSRPLGLVTRPAGWTRTTWRDFCERQGLNFTMEMQKYGLEILTDLFSPWLMKTVGWPTWMQPPTEGSLDEESLRRLIDILLEACGDCQVVAYYCPTVMAHLDDLPTLFGGRLSEIWTLAHDVSTGGCSPQNWWPLDRSWVVYTDWDLTSTIIAATPKLSSELLVDDVLECYSVNGEAASDPSSSAHR